MPSKPEPLNTAMTHLAELRRTGLLDTPPEEVFDHFTALASKILGTPVVLVSLVDENRQFFKSQVGLPEPWASKRETPLTHSFCQHVVASRQPLVIADARQDPLVSKNLAIEDLGVIAYAGIPLTTPQGDTIGSFCAIDVEPRVWTEHEVEVLTGLAQAVMTEIALRMNAQELQRTTKRLEGILESIADAFFQLDKDWCLSFVNSQALQLLGRTKEEVLGRNFWELYPAWVDSTFARQYREAAASQKPVTFEEFIPQRGMWLEVHVYPGEDGLAVYFQDISARKEAEKRLLLFESAIVQANDAIIIAEAPSLLEQGSELEVVTDPRIRYVNAAFTRMTGYSAEEVLGRSPRLLLGMETSEESLDQLNNSLATGQATSIELPSYRKDGSLFWAETSLVPVVDSSGNPSYWISIKRDVTERRRIEETLKVAKDEAELARAEAERANLAKSDFLSRMSHELRTPLNAILGFGQLLQASSLPAEDLECADHIVVAGRHLLELINEVLDIAQIESGRMNFSVEPVAVRAVCQEVVALVRGGIMARGLTLDDQSEHCVAQVQADRQRLKQVLVNLLSNASKYSRDSACIRFYCEKREGQTLRLCVQDQSPGIPPEKLERLFTPFERLGAETTTIEGVGIGLALSRRLAESMGGTVGVESTMDVGSTFWVEMPLAEEPVEQVDKEVGGARPNDPRSLLAVSSLQERTRKVLYIEDNLLNVRLIEQTLQGCPGVELLCAMDGPQGLKIAGEQLPDLILLDLQLPGMDGEEVLGRLKESEPTRLIPVIVVSANTAPSQVDRVLQNGATAYLTKPFVLRDFFNLVSANLGM
jgi:PAS domain S-box-containing protein